MCHAGALCDRGTAYPSHVSAALSVNETPRVHDVAPHRVKQKMGRCCIVVPAKGGNVARRPSVPGINVGKGRIPRGRVQRAVSSRAPARLERTASWTGLTGEIARECCDRCVAARLPGEASDGQDSPLMRFEQPKVVLKSIQVALHHQCVAAKTSIPATVTQHEQVEGTRQHDHPKAYKAACCLGEDGDGDWSRRRALRWCSKRSTGK